MQEKIPNLVNKEENLVDINAFHKEIAELKTKREKGEVEGFFELLSLENIENLTDEDAKMWEKINGPEANLITEEDFKKYKEDVSNSKDKSRAEFLSIIIQKITVIWLNRDTKIRENQNKK